MGRHEKSQIKLYHPFFGELNQIEDLGVGRPENFQYNCTLSCCLIPALNLIAIFFPFLCRKEKNLAHKDNDIPGDSNIGIVLCLGSSVYYQHSIFYLRSFNGGIGSMLRRQNGSYM